MLTRYEKDRWVAALRSGKYKQGFETLHPDDTFCCLGVLCDLQNPDGWEYKAPQFALPFPQNYRDLLEEIPPNQRTDLVGMNDIQKLSFDLIADWIEKHIATED